ncbi:2-amino-4-hydroxy-6-hydroxymethyldihydropteridine diphosphokinase [Xanthomonadaceae bacterium XH05]|nr:2-amino-4-hydroxy-6-hydroxymethyldihydropteridine diphosphokinase [Xanthomonadaceae bacterium XH05]
MGLALLSLGSNIEPARHLASAATALRQAFPDVRFSPVYRYVAVGFDGPDFLNAGAALTTALSPEALNGWLHALEDAHGRRRDVPRFSSRTLDIDLVFYDGLICEGPGNLKLPRPELKHAFVLEPLAALVPEFVDPLSGKTLAALWSAHADHAHRAHAEPLDL